MGAVVIDVQGNQPLAEEALSLPITVRDHRDSIQGTLMYIEVARKRQTAALQWVIVGGRTGRQHARERR
ncbi:MAG TPA: hypothetical protein VN708_06285 [Terriglobales bacterium]|jgi:hypothetical protein|nr:hypothetical protein [Terriglobales bacterium]